ncbi:MAG: 6-bladed beta-propeller [Parabacteroides sp.]|nr:6-bladed beta-propeller [Parabacteroides sp.]
MNKLLALISGIGCAFWTGCSSVNTKTLDECPVVIQTEMIDGNPLVVCDQKLLSDTLQIPLSLLTEDMEIIRFDNREDALVGEQMVVVSDNYLLVWNYNENPVRLFDRKGKFLTNLGASGQGPGEYWAIYDAQIDEANNRIYMLPWTSGQLLVYDLEGNVMPPIPLCLNIPKGKLWINAEESEIAVFALPFPNVPAVAWTQDFKEERKEYIEAGSLTAYDFNSEVYCGYNNPGIFDCMLKYCLPTRKDTLYHYDFRNNRLIPHFTMTFTTTDPIPNHEFYDLPSFPGSDSQKHPTVRKHVRYNRSQALHHRQTDRERCIHEPVQRLPRERRTPANQFRRKLPSLSQLPQRLLYPEYRTGQPARQARKEPESRKAIARQAGESNQTARLHRSE